MMDFSAECFESDLMVELILPDGTGIEVEAEVEAVEETFPGKRLPPPLPPQLRRRATPPPLPPPLPKAVARAPKLAGKMEKARR